MDYLIDCLCGHDLTRHDESGCRGNDSRCTCLRTKLSALDSAIQQARINPWGDYIRKPSSADAGEDAA
jgi:hypothetical protein